jgi:hypothetical protein
MINRHLKKYSKSSKKNKRNKRNKRKTLKNKRIMNRGGNKNENVLCSMCENFVNKKDTLIPRVCLNEYGRKAHRICKDCWWNPDTGFAREGSSHGCPGCEKNIPFTKITSNSIKINTPNNIIDLTKD